VSASSPNMPTVWHHGKREEHGVKDYAAKREGTTGEIGANGFRSIAVATASLPPHLLVRFARLFSALRSLPGIHRGSC
jgi:hypothetical protein